jgi:amino acid transporter
MAASGILTGVFMVVRSYGGEFHPWNRAARTVREKLSVTGMLVLVTSIASLAATALAAAAIAVGLLPESRIVPTAAQMLHVPTIVLGSLAGGAILTLMMYLNFASVVKIETENLTAVMACSPLTVWAFQELGVLAGLIDARRPEPAVVAVMVVCIAAVLLIIRSGMRARRLRGGVAIPSARR